MDYRTNRRLNPRPGGQIIGFAFLGLLLGVLVTVAWAHIAMTPVQRHCLPLYIQTSLPLTKTVSRNSIRSALGTAVEPKDKSMVAKKPIYSSLFMAVYKQQRVTQVLVWPLGIVGVFALAGIVFGSVRAAKIRRQMENGIQLRGPKMLTINQFNKVTKGDGLPLYVRDLRVKD